MVCKSSVMVWLCWIAICILPFVQFVQGQVGVNGGAPQDVHANFLGGDGEYTDDEGGGDDGGIWFGLNEPGHSGDDYSQDGDQAAADQEYEGDMAPIATLTVQDSAMGESSDRLVMMTSSHIKPSIPVVGIPVLAPSSTDNMRSLSNDLAPEPTSSADPSPPSATVELTMTTSITIYVATPTLTITMPIPAEDATLASAQVTASPLLDLAPLPTRLCLSAGAKAGIGIGVTLGFLMIAGAMAYAIYRRRKQSVPTSAPSPPRRSLAFSAFFRPGAQARHKYDPEWTIESASKVSIIRAGSVRSIPMSSPSHSRSNTPSLIAPSTYQPSEPNPTGDGLEVLSVGMAVPTRKPSPVLVGLALTSNLPTSPSEVSWPLVDEREGKTGM